jgi:hypothetical protein
MLNIWSVKSGHSIVTLQERTVHKDIHGVDHRIRLPLLVSDGELSNITFNVISGALPQGLRLIDNYISGSPYEVVRTTVSTFVIRARNSVTEEISDRTLSITVEGADAPRWITAEGTLPVGAVPHRTARIISASRDNNNIVTLTTDGAHEFVFDNEISVNALLLNSNLPFSDINTKKTKIIRPPFVGVESPDEYLYRVAHTITYRDPGIPFATRSVSAGSIVQLLKTPLTFVLDGTYIDFQLLATDTDLRAGDELDFFIEDNKGQLPPGLSLSRSGRITGFIDPILALDITARDGSFDVNTFDDYPYDFAPLPNIGIAGYEQVQTPKKLNRFYEFIVTVTDGETVAQRSFKIYVVGDDFLRTDNTVMKIGGGAYISYTSDSTYLRSPIWLSAANLGIKRANNYVTVILDTFDPNPAIGPVDYKLEKFNPNGTASELPKGLALDPSNSEIFGFIPYQPAVTIDYTFTISATKYDKENIEQIEVEIVNAEVAPIGQNYLKINKLPTEDQVLITNDNIRIGTYTYKINNYEPLLTQTYDIIRLDKPLQTVVIKNFVMANTYYRVLSQLYTTRKSSKTFTMQLLGEVDSVIKFITPANLGSVRANLSSELEIQATTTVTGAILTYRQVNGTLPPGVELRANGELIGRVTQFGNIVYRSFWKIGKQYKINDVVKYQNQLYKANFAHTSTSPFNIDYWDKYTFKNNLTGLTTYDSRTTSFDGRTGTQDRSYTFTVLAQDQFKYSAITGTFTVFVEDPDVKLFSNVYVKPFPTIAKRAKFYTFINDLDIFTESKIYRPSDPNFGVQKELKMLIYAGIETLEIKNYVPALAMNTKRKRFRIGSPKKAVSRLQGSSEVIYEVIYLEIFDEYEIGKIGPAQAIKLQTTSRSSVNVNQTSINPVNGKLDLSNNKIRDSLNDNAVDRIRNTDPIKADTTAIKASGKDIEYIYPSSVSNIRRNIKTLMVGDPQSPRPIDTENSFLPSWMITPQDSKTPATGYIKAVPLCYCKPGEADYILENITYSGFDFTSLDFEIDRFIIDAVSGNNEDQYLKIPNYKFNV